MAHVHDNFYIINCLFSEENDALAAGIEDITREDLDTGVVSSDRTYWKALEKQYNEGFHENSVYWKEAKKQFNEDFPEKSFMALCLLIKCISGTQK